MDELRTRAETLQAAVADALTRIQFGVCSPGSRSSTRRWQLQLWANADAAQSVVKEQASLEKRLQPWQGIQQSVDEAVELLGLHDTTMEAEIAAQVQAAETAFEELKEELKFSGVRRIRCHYEPACRRRGQ